MTDTAILMTNAIVPYDEAEEKRLLDAGFAPIPRPVVPSAYSMKIRDMSDVEIVVRVEFLAEGFPGRQFWLFLESGEVIVFPREGAEDSITP